MRKPIAPRAALAGMSAEHGIREGREGMLRLDFNENTVGCSAAVATALRRMTREHVAIYPEYSLTRKRLARYFRVRPEELALTNGADEALRLVFDTYVERGETVLLVKPTFPMYYLLSHLFDARIVALHYDARMQFPLEEALRALRAGPRVFFLANPNNPTGTLLGQEEIRRILEAARKTLVVVDEAYTEFCGVTVLPWINRYKNLVVVRTFSKGNGLAGLRLGCLVANRETATAFCKAQTPFPVNSAALVAARAAAGDHKYMGKYVREILRARRELENALNRLGVRSFPSGGNFLLVDFGPRAPQVLKRLERKRILLRDQAFNFGRPGFVRITVGTRAQMARLARALERAL